MKIALIVIAVLIVALGGGFAAASLGFVQVPGVSPTVFGKPVHASKDEHFGLIDTLSAPLQALVRRATADAAVVKKPVSAKPVDTTPKPDPVLGDEKIAQIWNGLDSKNLASITANWPDVSLAKILLKMDSDQVTAYLAEVPTARAAKLSKAIQNLASLPGRKEGDQSL